MTFFGKEIPTDKINFVMNVVSFILGLIFFIRMQGKFAMPHPAEQVANTERDSLLLIETKLNAEIGKLKSVQDSLFKAITDNEVKLSQQTVVVNDKIKQVRATIKSEWDGLDRDTQTEYINKLMLNLKTKKQ